MHEGGTGNKEGSRQQVDTFRSWSTFIWGKDIIQQFRSATFLNKVQSRNGSK